MPSAVTLPVAVTCGVRLTTTVVVGALVSRTVMVSVRPPSTSRVVPSDSSIRTPAVSLSPTFTTTVGTTTPGISRTATELPTPIAPRPEVCQASRTVRVVAVLEATVRYCPPPVTPSTIRTSEPDRPPPVVGSAGPLRVSVLPPSVILVTVPPTSPLVTGGTKPVMT